MAHSEIEIQAELDSLPDWNREGQQWIQRNYEFANYLSALKFVQRIGEHAEEVQHHPHIVIDHTSVTVSLSSLDVESLTERDFKAAAQFEKLFEEAEK